ncbi:C-type lectin domain family 10 member A [Biomphalaria pfeifferi]|uniref:C-type lectin domain family 10 member A n=1 Tax=Biomphalaria pfeifferi TaxID=112525 RepID=A0AAD8C4A3_BIOPF|nr:C-type lectin domain family 10 member A [Biomphalaria pfeifferi]
MFKKAYFVESIKFLGSTYLLSKDSHFFYPSFGQAMCGGYLVEVNTVQELEFIKHFLFEKASRFVHVLTGWTDDDHEGLWVNRYSQTKVDLLWNPGQPDDHLGLKTAKLLAKFLIGIEMMLNAFLTEEMLGSYVKYKSAM